MTNNGQNNASAQIDFNRILTVAAAQNGVRITYLNGAEELIVLTYAERNRFLDRWLGIADPQSDGDSTGTKAAG